jgi:putative transposase
MPGNGHVRFGGRPDGKGPAQLTPRRPADPTRTVRDQFLVEAGDGAAIADLAEMNRLFQAWLETVYHQGVHSETGEEPIARWAKATPAERAVPGPAALREAFLWSERRKVTKTALVSLHGNSYQVDAWLAGKYVELVFDPFDLAHIEVRAGGKPAGTAVPFTVSRHRHPKTRTDGQQRAEPAPTGIDYLAALGDAHDAGLRDQVSYRSLIGTAEEGNSRQEDDGNDTKGGNSHG